MIDVQQGSRLRKLKILDSFVRIQNQVKRITDLTGNLLEFARRSRTDFENVPLNDLVRASLGFLQIQLEHRDITTILDLSEPSAVVYGNYIELQQVLLNLLLNSRDAMDKAKRKELTIITQVSGNDAVLFVKDTGCGIPKKDWKQVFNPFFTTKAVGEGTGLGLSVSYGIVDSHAGKITFDSELGLGSTFSVILPKKK